MRLWRKHQEKRNGRKWFGHGRGKEVEVLRREQRDAQRWNRTKQRWNEERSGDGQEAVSGRTSEKACWVTGGGSVGRRIPVLLLREGIWERRTELRRADTGGE
ncbi:hypothetical protein PC128_g4099 [Phytophthora cactorum]|nr:hypothetical protein PC128_g4099 [Phytophthora cactorum]KAG4040726.1 hypothetical protein PC123_g23742 [Phytophthora cactorum]